MVTDEVEQTIDALMEQKDLTPNEAAEREAVADARRKMSEQLAATQAPVDTEALSRPSATVWTLQAMRKQEPVPADLYGDGSFMFTFDPGVMTSEYAQVRLDRADKYFRDRKEGKQTAYRFVQVTSDYVDVAAAAIVTWDAKEHVRDEMGNLMYDEAGEPVTRPIPPSRDNISLLGHDVVVQLLNACNASMAGEVNGQP